MAPTIDPRTPVLIGAGQFCERISDAGYVGHSPAELAAAAARRALADTGADPSLVAAAIDTIATTRQFENSTPMARAPLGLSNNLPRSVAARIGADPARAVLEVSGGQSPQHLVNEFARAIAEGHADVVLLAGAEAISTLRHFQQSDSKPNFNEVVEGQLEDRGFGLGGLMSRQLAVHGAANAPSMYALLENARRARLGLSLEQSRHEMGRLFAPFSAVAASNSNSASHAQHSVEALATETAENRQIASPYLRYLVARDQVNQSAALILTSVESARQLGIPEEKWIFLHGHADLVEKPLLERTDLGAYPAGVASVREALRVADVSLEDISAFDFYSCFPIAVSAVCDEIGLAPNDPRGLTLTGGLPFFGGPGNNYSMHAIAEAVGYARSHPGRFVLVGANGGVLSKYSTGVYSSQPTPVPYASDRSSTIQTMLDNTKGPKLVTRPEGWGVIESYTVVHNKDGSTRGVVVGRMEQTSERFVANPDPQDAAMMKVLNVGEPVGTRVYASPTARGNRIALASGDGTKAPIFRSEYEFVQVRRDGHVLEITINRPDARNALHPPAHDELDEVLNAYFSDPDLWVAILTGAGDKAFCAGNDLIYTASGKPMWMPGNGFGGVTSRRAMTKPVIAAVNGFAMGGGFEIALACHLVVADASARFALSEVKVGLIAGAGGLVRLPRTIPQKKANELILTGRQLSAEEAFSLGLVNRVAEAGQALAVARELAAEIVQSSPTSIRLSLHLMNDTQGIADTLDAVAFPSVALDDLMGTQDCWEGLAAFAQKRQPHWTNR
ncbi:acetyl-CoA acetyltransferase [Pseudomonas sp. NFX224]|uniref:acetyl-CoA acetyltransferase n=1 Tax=Pseudomonas sp. NFX224 TaxID=3402862 RepID=UPI003AFA56D2